MDKVKVMQRYGFDGTIVRIKSVRGTVKTGISSCSACACACGVVKE